MSDGSYRETLREKGLPAFLTTQFLGAFNDNVSKMIVSLMAMDAYGKVEGPAFVGGVFIFPFLIFSGYAGFLADKLSKRTILVSVKVFEIVIMTTGLVGLATHHVTLMLAVMFMMGTHSTFFGPSKYGIVPELVRPEHMSAANGLLEMSTFAAIVLGTSLGGTLFVHLKHAPWMMGVALVVIAVTGLITSFGIPRVAPAKPDARFSINPVGEVWHGAVRLWPDRTLWMTMIGISFFWFLGALLQTALLPFGQAELHLSEDGAAFLYSVLAIGIAIGSLVAGRLSGERIELGLVPVGAFGLGVFSLLLAASTTVGGTSVVLAILGFFGGFFAVPLNALLQQKPAENEKGRIQATNNFFNTLGILLAVGLLGWLGGPVGLSTRTIMMGAGVFTLLASVYVLMTLPEFFVRFTLWMLTHTIYRIRIVGKPHIPSSGPALIICNHVSMIDCALVGACVQRFVRFIVYGPIFQQPGVHMLLKRMHAIPITPGKRGILDALERAHRELAEGHVVCIFAEGSVSRTGNLLPFKRGFERIVAGLDVPVIPVYLDRVWGSVFSFKRGKFFWKLPEHLPYPVTVAWGAPMRSTVTAVEARSAIMDLGAEAMRYRRHPGDLLHTAFMRSAKRNWRRLAMADSTGQKLTYGRTLVGALLLGGVIRKRTSAETTGANIGVLLPASVGGALANIAVLMAGKVPVNLNFTSGAEAMALAMAESRIQTIVTSKRFLSKASIAEMPGMVFLEDLREEIGSLAKIRTLLLARLLPVALLRRFHGGLGRTADSVATIIFSSGSTGVPKGVVISHANLLANIDSLAQIFPMNEDDCFIGVLPFFHSFGLTGTLWFPLLQGSSLAYHPNPMDAKTIGELAETYRASMLISTPTFCNAYVRKCTKEQFAHLKYAIVGAEKLREPLAIAFREKFGVGLLEGYGCTEMSPVVAVNRPNIDIEHEHQIGTKPGSVGHPIPGVAAKVVDQDTGEGPLTGREGLILVKGSNLMQGYLNQPEKTADAIRDGWYVTGDIGRMDEDGFIFITDRLSRFSKIGGEMVPHIKIEDAINGILGDMLSAVTAVPDAAKGEKLIAFYTRADVTPEALWEQLGQTDLPKLWIPRRDSLILVEAIPTLGTGKMDLRGLKQLALQRSAEKTDSGSRLAEKSTSE